MIDKDEIDRLAIEWMHQKKIERKASEMRREIEDRLNEILEISETREGTTTKKQGSKKIIATSRINRKVNADILQEIAAENGIDHVILGQLFSWEPKLKMKEWKAANEEITDKLSAAITSKPGRPSYKIEIINEED